MPFTESNTVEALVRDVLCGGVTHHTAAGPGLARRGGAVAGLGWHYLAPRDLRRRRTRCWWKTTCGRRWSG